MRFVVDAIGKTLARKTICLGKRHITDLIDVFRIQFGSQNDGKKQSFIHIPTIKMERSRLYVRDNLLGAYFWGLTSRGAERLSIIVRINEATLAE